MSDARRGDLWWVDFTPARGSEQAGHRPALVVQTDSANRQPRYSNTIVVPLSTKGRDLPFHILVAPAAGNGLAAPSYVRCEHLLTISNDRLQRRLGRLSDEDMVRVAHALRLVLAL